MSMYTSKELGALQTCPYNKSHQISQQKFTTHLIKCRNSQPNLEYSTCPFDAAHKVPNLELEHHINHCSMKKEFDKQVFLPESSTTIKYQVEGGVILKGPQEQWDEHVGASYNPRTFCEQNKIIRMKKVEPNAVKKSFKQDERQRFQMLEQAEERQRKRKEEEAALQKAKEQSEISQRETSTLSDTSNTTELPSHKLIDSFSNLRVHDDSESSTATENTWVKIKGKRGRGVGRRQ